MLDCFLDLDEIAETSFSPPPHCCPIKERILVLLSCTVPQLPSFFIVPVSRVDLEKVPGGLNCLVSDLLFFEF